MRLFQLAAAACVITVSSSWFVNAQDNTNLSAQRPFRPGDAVGIRARPDMPPDSVSFLTGTYVIGPDGFIDLPIEGRLRVTDFTEQQLRDRLSTKYSQYLPFPDLQIRPLLRLSLLGGYLTPGMFYLDPDISLWEALRQAGGTEREDGLRKLRWERNGEVVQRDMNGTIQSGATLRSIGVQSGDLMRVTTREKHQINGFRDVVVPITSLAFSMVVTSLQLYLLFYTTSNSRN